MPFDVIRPAIVALRKESVDRNMVVALLAVGRAGSLSARRAWIEIGFVQSTSPTKNTSLSARRAWIEINNVETAAKASLSLSARRAWIEIASRRRVSGRALVALRKESVDRNALSALGGTTMPESLSARRAWIEIV